MKKLILITLCAAGLVALTVQPAQAALVDLIPQNPRGAELADITQILLFLIKWALAFSAAIAAIFVVISGYQYVLAAGNPEKLEKAKMGLTWAITGFLLTLSAYGIVLLLQKTLGAKTTVDQYGNSIPGPDSAGTVLGDMMHLIFAFAGTVAIIFLILGGYRYITSQGNPELADKAKKTVLYSVIGLTVVFASWAVFDLITDTIKVRPENLP